jgi:hypothetical protein
LTVSLFISDHCKVVDKSPVKQSGKKTYVSMFRDERGVLEPHAELLSTALAVIGFVVFAAILSQTYLGYEDRSFALENYESASLLAETLAGAPALKAESSSMFSGNYLFLVDIQTGDGRWHWQIKPNNSELESFTEGREKVAASVPVVIELNPAESVPGSLTVVLYKTAWK